MNSDKKHIVLLAGKKSHGPDDNGIHDYPAQARLLHDCLQRSPLADMIHITRLENDDWQADVIDTADCLVVISDGRDGDLPYEEASHLRIDQRKQQLKKRIAQGMGLVPIHFATFASKADMQDALDWQGAIFHWEQNGKRDWKSKITWSTSVFDRMQQQHPILNGVGSPKLREEFYHQLSFHPEAVPLIQIRALPTQSDDPKEQAVAWCLERHDGGRSFGTTMGHSLDIFRVDGLRTLVLNGIAWSAGLEIPEEGLQIAFAEREEVTHRVADGPQIKPIRVTMLSGNNAHRWHNWAETTGALLRVFGDDDRIQTRVTTCPDDLVSDLQDCDVLVLNWVNWHDPVGLSDAVKQAIEDFTIRGGGVFVHHFANGACHASLPQTDGKSDWPWYRTLVQRVWEHRDIAPGRSHHDKFGPFEVRPQGRHPLAAGLKPFEVTDELYWRQHGDMPIEEPLLVATSNITGSQEPLAWAYQVNESRVVQSLLGHSAATYAPSASQAFVRRVIAWCAKRPIHGSLADGTTE